MGAGHYRYIGETRTIGYAELTALLDSRDQQTQKILASRVSRIADLGPENVSIMDTNTGLVEGQSGSFLIDGSLLSKIKFITEGKFTETEGEPTLRLIGDVEPLHKSGPELIRTEKTIVTNEDVLTDFVNQVKVPNPEAYIRHVVHDQALWMRVFYYIHLSGLTLSQAVKLIKDERTSRSSHKKKLLDRISGRKGHKIPAGPSTKPYKEAILSREGIDFDTVANRIHAVRSIQTIPSDELTLAPCLKVLKDAIQDNNRNPADIFLSEARYAAAHLDASIFGSKISD